MRKVFGICAAVAVLAAFAGRVEAQCATAHRYGYQPGFQSYTPSFYQGMSGSHRHWHDTSHWDYHPARIVPHGNHFHIAPRHYHWHQEGHFDHH
jgi:hypothetical protein